ncbi:AAA family ATPase (macronuclear) [Tetrahymena thermophila SB210]|uniref:AAA family ATPase n=1 Tax=Tetrahymena thermophila (strain SB210) TaxID=312017 RepID=W7XFI1_TETTS|nr:AAA family ATPase [Tetrahymena thermophila SB210]EWS76597.1 AAA family ATPase [Tetrahymena thermophila SB210]|eukprot:XP_012650883.1 AAA family ATPase [Tetrahymena thermophila SB210]
MLSNVNNGCQAQLILLLLAINILIGTGAAVLFTYMSANSCSRAFQAAAGASYTYILLSFLQLTVTYTWKQIPVQLMFLLHLFVFLDSIVTLAFSVTQSFCGYNICIAGLNETEFYSWFNGSIVKSQIQVSCYDSTSVESEILRVAKQYQGSAQFNYGDQYSINYGWPISISVLMMLITFLTLLITYKAIYSCDGCVIRKSDFQKTYFQFSDDEDDDEES